MRLAVVGRAEDPLSQHALRTAREAGHTAELIELSAMSSGTPVVYDGEGFIVGAHELERFDAFFIRSYPAQSALLGVDPNASLSVDQAWQRTMMQRDRHDFALGCLMALEISGKRMVNPPLASAAFDMKPLQLAVLQQAGIPVPRTLVTNFPVAVRAFAEDVPEVIFKPTGGGAETQLLTPEVSSSLEGRLGATPVIFQERIRGADIRVTVVGDEIASSVSIPSHDVDYRLGETYRAGAQQYLDHPLPDDIRALCLRVAKLNRLVLAGIDLKLDAAGKYYVLEANSGPVYLDIELKTGAPITRRIVDWLAA